MKVVTEAFLRSLFLRESPERFTLAEGQLLTPSARAFLAERRVKIETAAAADKEAGAAPAASADPAPAAESSDAAPASACYVSALDGGGFGVKPEHYTHLRGNRLIAKDHDRIIFRGKLDSFQSAILMVQANALEKGAGKLSDELGEILDWVREIMKAEVLDVPLEKQSVLGLTPEELRAHSHNPKKAYGVPHITPSAEMGSQLLGLNFLRSLSREVETAGVRAFHREFEMLRPDILTALNRMSSALYIMMARERAGIYAANGAVGGSGYNR